jgi:hypothetical protein
VRPELTGMGAVPHKVKRPGFLAVLMWVAALG